MSLLNEKIAVVTNASSDIGFAIVSTFIEHGARVIGIGPDEPAPRSSSQTARSYSFNYLLSTGSFTYVRSNGSAHTTIECAMDVAVQPCRCVDILVNNGAMLPLHCPTDTAASADWESILQNQLPSVSRWSARLLPLMRSARYGRIINIGSALSEHATLQDQPYVASKHTLLGLTRAQALEYGRYGITANCLLLDGVDTELLRRSNTEGAYRRYVESQCPLGRMADVREIASIVVFLASALSSYVNGCALVADGGLSLDSQQISPAMQC